MKKIIYNSIFFVMALILPVQLFAMDFFFESDHSIYGVNDTIVVDVLLDSEEIINTISGTVQIEGSEDLRLSVNEGNSAILFWVDKPKIEGNSIAFSGISPGGIQGSSLFLFSIEIQGQSLAEDLKITMSNGVVLIHDGQGTEQKVGSILKKVYISEDDLFAQEPQAQVDVEKPEDFTPVITRDENLFEGKNVLVFATQDKGTGILEYRIKEGYLGSYVQAESPYVLQDQKLLKPIFVKAIDRSGNERLVVVHPQEKIFDENFILIFSILIIVIAVSIIVYRKKNQ